METVDYAYERCLVRQYALEDRNGHAVWRHGRRYRQVLEAIPPIWRYATLHTNPADDGASNINVGGARFGVHDHQRSVVAGGKK